MSSIDIILRQIASVELQSYLLDCSNCYFDATKMTKPLTQQKHNKSIPIRPITRPTHHFPVDSEPYSDNVARLACLRRPVGVGQLWLECGRATVQVFIDRRVDHHTECTAWAGGTGQLLGNKLHELCGGDARTHRDASTLQR